MNTLEISKLGGTSVDDLEQSGKVVANSLASDKATLVFVSARSGVTTALLDTIRVAVKRGITEEDLKKKKVGEFHQEEEDDESDIPNFWEVLGENAVQLHTYIDKHVDSKEAKPLHKTVDERTEEAMADFAAMARIKILSPRIRDKHCFRLGEGIVGPAAAAHFRCCGMNAVHYDATEVIATDGTFGNANPFINGTRDRFQQSGLNNDLQAGKVVVVDGYGGSDRFGYINTFSRGGTDLSATTAGYVLTPLFKHIEVILYKADPKVLAVMSADPNIIHDVYTVNHLVHEEARALAAAGGNILHPKAVHQAVWSGSAKREPFPIYVRSTLRPELLGTLIDHRQRSDDPPIQAMTRMKSVIRAGITGWGMDRSGIAAKFFRVFSDRGVDISAIIQSASKASLDIAYQFEKKKGIEKECKIIEATLREALKEEISVRDIDQAIIVKPSQLIGIIGRSCMEPRARRKIIDGMVDFSELGTTNAYEEISGDYDISILVNLPDDRFTALLQSIHDSVFGKSS